MSLRYTGAWMQDGAFNPLTAPTPSYNNSLYTWGQNGTYNGSVIYGQLGLNTQTAFYSSPKQVGSLTNWLSIAGGRYHTAAVKTDGTLWTWGSNGNYNGSVIFGQLGLNNQTLTYSSPKQVGSLTNWLSVSANYSQVFGLKTNGTLWAWGCNAFGLLGLGNTTYYSSPKQVGSLTNWLSISAGNYNTAGIKTDGTLWMWGFNTYGQLGFGNRTHYSSPKQVGALTNWSSISCGTAQTIAIKTDGTLWAWGDNSNGQLGLNNRTSYSSPKQVGSLTNWSLLGVGPKYASTIVIKTDGTLWSWGQNNSGQLGLGNTTYYSSPKQVGSLTNWSKLFCGKTNSIAVKTNGTLWSWGNNGSGQLGLGNTTYYSSPKQVGSLTNWYSAGCGWYGMNVFQRTASYPYTQYGGSWTISQAADAKAAGTWSG